MARPIPLRLCHRVVVPALVSSAPLGAPARDRAAVVLGVAFLLAALAAPAHGARRSHQVNADGVAGSDVEDHFLSPDAEWVIWEHDQQINDRPELWAARRFGGTPKLLSGTLPVGGFIGSVRVTPDSKRVVYVADQETAGKFELFAVPLMGTAADGVKLSPELAATGDVATDVQLTADGTLVVFRTSVESGGATLFAVPVAGPATAAVPLDAPLGPNGSTSRFAVIGDRVVFSRRHDQSSPRELWSVPVGGPAGVGVRLTPTLPAGAVGVVENTGAYWPSPDGTRVAFAVSETADEKAELWIADVAGAAGSATKIGPMTIAEGDVRGLSPIFNPDGSRIVFTADRDVDEMVELYSVVTDGSAAPVQLNVALVATGDVGQVALTVDGTHMLYTADWAVDGRAEGFVVPVTGPSTASAKLTQLPAGETALGIVELEPGLTLFGVGDIASGNPLEVRGVPTLGPAASGWTVTGQALTSIGSPVALVGNRYVFTGDLDTAGEHEIWSSRVDGSDPDPNSLFHPLWSAPTLIGTHSASSPDGAEFFYLAAPNGGADLRLYAAPTVGASISRVPARLDPAGVAGTGALDDPIRVTPDGHGVLFLADPDVSTRNELFMADRMVFGADFDEEGNTSEWSP